MKINANPKNALSIIALFVGIIELSFAYPVTKLEGSLQIIIIYFMVCFPILVLFCFLFILIKYPENLYSPSDFTDSKEFVGLITRKDEKIRTHLDLRTKEVINLSKNTLNNIEKISNSIIKLSDVIEKLPQLNKDSLKREYDNFLSLLDEAKTITYAYNKNVAIKYIEDIWSKVGNIRIKNFSNCTFQFIVDVIVEVQNDIKTKEIKHVKDLKGQIIVQDFDYNCKIDYEVKEMEVLITFSDHYSTVG